MLLNICAFVSLGFSYSTNNWQPSYPWYCLSEKARFCREGERKRKQMISWGHSKGSRERKQKMAVACFAMIAKYEPRIITGITRNKQTHDWLSFFLSFFASVTHFFFFHVKLPNSKRFLGGSLLPLVPPFISSSNPLLTEILALKQFAEKTPTESFFSRNLF